MSTQINITVDSGGLSRKAKQQTAVNRLLKMEDDHQKKVGKEAADKREAALKAKLLGPDGKPLYGVPAPAPVRKEEPAAFRYGYTGIVIEPSAGHVNHVWPFNARKLKGVSVRTPSGSDLTFLPSGGPSGSKAFTWTTTNNSSLMQQRFELYYPEGTPATLNANTWTVEAWIKTGGSGAGPGEEGNASDYTGAVITALFNTVIISIEADFSANRYLRIEIRGAQPNAEALGNAYNKYFYPGTLTTNTWHHVAVTQATNGYFIFLDGALLDNPGFVTSTSNPFYGMLENTPYLQVTGNGMIYNTWRQELRGPYNAAIHGYRITAKALYQSAFTPPATITQLA